MCSPVRSEQRHQEKPRVGTLGLANSRSNWVFTLALQSALQLLPELSN